MDRGALERLSRAELIELVVRMTEMIALVGRLEDRIAELEGRLADRAAEAADRAAPPKTSENSSVPPSVGFKADRPERRARKRRRGHAGISRRRQTPDVIVRCRPSTCAGCGEPLPRVRQRRVSRSQVIELPPVRPVVVEAWQYAARCGGCGHRTKGASPAGLEPTRTFGPQSRPRAFERDELDVMLREARTPKVHDWLVNYVVKKNPHAEALRLAWFADPDPVVASAGWALTTERVAKKPEGLDLAGLLDVVEAQMKDAPDRLQWAMNHCLAQIGIEHAEHRDRAIDIGERLEVLKDYPTPPNCTSPYAPIWITEMVRRQDRIGEAAHYDKK